MNNNLSITCIYIILLLGFLKPVDAQVVFYPENNPGILGQISNYNEVIEMPKLNEEKVEEAIQRSLNPRSPFKFGLVHKVKLNLTNSGIWQTLPNGNRVWQLKIYAPDATTINLNYDKFDLPAGAKLYVYNETLQDVLGPFTHQNERPNKRFATSLVRGEYCIVEYHEPKKLEGEGILQIGGVVHGFRTLGASRSSLSNGDAGPCHYDVGCSIGSGWEDQIKSVAMILTGENDGGCTGTLINNTANDCEPYFLTADHCFGNDNAGDQLDNIFLFNYESPTPACPGYTTGVGQINQSVQGCTILSKSVVTDFALLKLSDNPIDYYDVYYSGWDRRNIGSPGAVGIHHSVGDLKKISVEQDPIISSSDDLYWLVPDWDFGSTEGGASGSAVFDTNSKRILGQLCCGNADCDGASNNGGSDDYGKIYYSWDQLGPTSSEQLKPWLDPINSGALFIDGYGCAETPTAAFEPVNQTTIKLCEAGDIQLIDKSTRMPTSWSWTFSGAGVSPTTSNLQHPIINLSTDGLLTVNLTASNSTGSDATTYNYAVDFVNCLENSYCITNVNIPDGDMNGISNSFTIPSTNNLIDLNIDVDITHPYVGDVIIAVEKDGVSSNLIYKPNLPSSVCGEEDIIATFSDKAIVIGQTLCDDNGIAISGMVRPQIPFSNLYSSDPGGTWTVTIADGGDDDIGVVNSVCINTTVAEIPCYNNLTHANGLLQTEIAISDYESSDLISTSLPTLIQAGAKVDYDAAQCIELNPPFEIEIGAEFEAFIDGCNDGNGGSN